MQRVVWTIEFPKITRFHLLQGGMYYILRAQNDAYKYLNL